MNDYLNPNSMLTPQAAQLSNPYQLGYAPSFDQSLMSEIQRKLQTEELLRHQNEMNWQDRRAKPYLTDKAISEADRDTNRAKFEASPDMVDAYIRSLKGGYQENEAKGRLAMETLEPTIAEKNATSRKTTAESDMQSNFYDIQKLYRPIQNIINAGGPNMQGNLQRVLKQYIEGQGKKVDWMNPQYAEALMALTKNPEALLQFFDNEMKSSQTQMDKAKLTAQTQSEMAARELEALRQQGEATKQKEDNSQTKLQTALLTQKTGQVKSQLSAYQKSISLLRLQYQTAKTEEEKAKYAQMIAAEGEAYNQTKAELDFLEQQLLQLSGLKPYSVPAQATTAPSPPNQGCFKGYHWDATKNSCVKD